MTTAIEESELVDLGERLRAANRNPRRPCGARTAGSSCDGWRSWRLGSQPPSGAGRAARAALTVAEERSRVDIIASGPIRPAARCSERLALFFATRCRRA